MKTLIFLLMMVSTAVVLGAPFYVSGDAPLTNNSIGCEVDIDAVTYTSVTTPATVLESDTAERCRLDLGALALVDGPHSASTRMVNVWGISLSSPTLNFTKGAPSPPSGAGTLVP